MLDPLNTLPVKLSAIIHHTSAVCRGTRRALVVTDMPFLTYHISVPSALRKRLNFTIFVAPLPLTMRSA